MFYHLYIKFEPSLDDLVPVIVTLFKEDFGLNYEPIKVEQREGANYGGVYYSFILNGFNMQLVSNEDDVLEEAHKAYNYYLIISSEPRLNNSPSALAGYIQYSLSEKGFDVVSKRFG